MWDLLIVGTGPAGVSAALTAKTRGLSFLWFGSQRLSDKVEKAERILNYPGLPQVPAGIPSARRSPAIKRACMSVIATTTRPGCRYGSPLAMG